MDQDAFRKLLSSRPGGGAATNQSARGSLLPSKNKAASQQNDAPATKSEFKPRKVKKTAESAYRDRATERRLGKAGDFAQAESLLEDFERRHANDEDKEAAERERKYLGGDAEHTVLVKGLDFALLEQTRARAAASENVDDDELLEAAFRGDASQSPPPVPKSPTATTTNGHGKKRTREEILAELKAKRGDQAPPNKTDKALEEVKKEGKFKPIGFKPIGSAASKLKDTKEKEGRKKKKRKLEGKKLGEDDTKVQSAKPVTKVHDEANTGPPVASPSSGTIRPPARVEAELPLDDNLDIFAGAEEYEGINLGDDDDDESGPDESSRSKPQAPKSKGDDVEMKSPSVERQSKRWFEDLEPSPPPDRPLPSGTNKDAKGKGRALSPSSPSRIHAPDDEGKAEREGSPADAEEPDESARARQMRLAPLTSSAVPSIRDILAADEALEAEDKRRARKEKRKAGKGGGGGGPKGEVSAEAKLNKDYQKLQAYTKKKGEAA